MTRKRCILIALLLITGFAALWLAERNRSEEAYNNHNLIRIQVLAHSDAPEDQALKYRVRDALVAELAPGLRNARGMDEARAAVAAALPRLQEVAGAEVAAAGRPYGVQVAYGNFEFPTRAYGNLVLPAGSYEALRVTLGAGHGANWWCIVFPPLCFVDVPLAPAAEAGSVVPADNPSPEAVADGNPSGGAVEVRFRLLEFLRRL
ncbi:MAG: stage II sporulation protein R [Firmicutes bacterium]|nr:stage II sporulation protein R [Bacillota bacterium]